MPDRPEQPRIMDITHPKDVQPATTSKPVIISNRPIIENDPMISAAAEPEKDEDVELPAGAHVEEVKTENLQNNHDAKTILPTDDLLKAIDHEKATPEVEDSPKTGAQEVDQKEETEASTAPSKPPVSTVPDQPIEEDESEEQEEDDGTPKPETDEQRREHELEEVIASGKYFVPINQIGKKRAKLVLIIVLCVLISIILFDLLLDMDIVQLSGVPHTTFFSL